jgi:dephospho-CoA kinase
MLKVGLTGNIGSGKSTVASIFTCLNVPVFSADDEAKKMYLDPDVQSQVVSLVGSGILDTKGKIIRHALASRLFADRILLDQVTSIIHPMVRQGFRDWVVLQTDKPYVILEAAILIESNSRNEVDLVVAVSCPEDLAIDRIRKRDMVTEERVRERMQFQLKDAEKASLADFVIINDGTKLVVPQVLEIHKKVLQQSAQKHSKQTTGK